MTRILFDARYIPADGYSGIGRFSERLIHELHRLHPLELLVHDDRLLPRLPRDAVVHPFHSPTGPLEPCSALRINRIAPDVFYSPMQTVGLFGRKFPAVLTLHDLIYYSHPAPPKDLPLPVRGLWRLYHTSYAPQRFLLGQPDAVVTVSETTKSLMLEHRLTSKPIHVVPNATEDLPGDPVPFADRTRDLVYMGSFMPYKNVATLVEMVNQLPGFRLRLPSRVSPSVEQELTKLAARPEQLHFDHGVDDDEYRHLLRHAFAAVTASRDEGFGIPVVEAMKAGTPVVCSDIPIFHEVAGDAALFTSPDSPADFAAQVRSLEKQARWDALARAGRERSGKFTWNRSAELLLDTLLSVA